MGKADKERLNRTLSNHLSNIHETCQALDQTPSSSLDKVSWNEVIKMGEQVSKHATMAGMLWTGEKPEVKVLEENMEAYFNLLQGLLLLAYGSTVGAGPTLASNIHVSITHVIDCSFGLWKKSVSSYGSHNEETNQTIPKLVGTVWEACSALKKTPTTNITAIGRAMTQVAVSIKDVLREMRELRPCSSTDEAVAGSSSKIESQAHDIGYSSSDELGNDLSPEEMKIAQLATEVVSETLAVIKELIRAITGLLKQESSTDKTDRVDSLEKLLKLCQDASLQIDELGACLYPPQELATITEASTKISSIADEFQHELDGISGSTDAFIQALSGLKKSLGMLQTVISPADDELPKNSISAELLAQMKNLTVQN